MTEAPHWKRERTLTCVCLSFLGELGYYPYIDIEFAVRIGRNGNRRPTRVLYLLYSLLYINPAAVTPQLPDSGAEASV